MEHEIDLCIEVGDEIRRLIGSDHEALRLTRRDGRDGGFIVWFKTQKGLEVGFRSLAPTGAPKASGQ